MRPTSPLSLLLFVALTTAFPLPNALKGQESCTAHGTCTSSSGRPTFKSIASLWHFSSRNPGALLPHKLSFSSTSEDEANAPLQATVPKDASTHATETTPTAALESNRPLSSLYLLSLQEVAPKPSQSEHASKMPNSAPTSSLPFHREKDAMRYAESMAKSGKDHEAHPHHATFEESNWESETVTGKSRQMFYGTRECSDVIVVAIVLLFLVAVMAVEVFDGFVGAVKSFFRVGEGKIRLEDHVDVERIEKPFQLQPAPRTRELMSVTVVEEAA